MIEKINSRLDFLRRVKDAKDAISEGLKIEWETDPENMKFEQLRSYKGIEYMFNFEVLRVEEYNITGTEFFSTNIFCGDQAKHYVELIEILMKGEKLIPPATIEGYALVDGQEKKVRHPATFSDGYHRGTLAKFFGLEVIPVVVFKAFEGYWFSPDKWSIDGGHILHKNQTENGMQCTGYNGIRAISKEGKEIIIKTGGAFIDDSNTEFLVISLPHNI